MTTVKKRNTAADRREEFEMIVSEFGGHRSQVRKIVKRTDELKKKIMEYLEKHGTADENGSQWVEFAEPIAGLEAIQRQRRAKVLLVEDKAEEILAKRGCRDDCLDVDITIDADQMEVVLNALRKAGLYDQVVTVTERINEDKIMAVLFEDKDKKPRDRRLTEDDIEVMLREEVTWACVPKDAR